MMIGYARVSRDDQNLDLQIDALQKVGCDRIFEEKESGGKDDRPELEAALDFVRPGDTLVVWRLDRLGRSLKHLIETVESLRERQIEFKSLQETIDTSTATGELVFNIFCSLAQFERRLIQERTRAGLASARARGRLGGRRKVLNQKQIEMGRALAQSTGLSIDAICEQLNCSRSTYYRYIAPKKSS